MILAIFVHRSGWKVFSLAGGPPNWRRRPFARREFDARERNQSLQSVVPGVGMGFERSDPIVLVHVVGFRFRPSPP